MPVIPALSKQVRRISHSKIKNKNLSEPQGFLFFKVDTSSQQEMVEWDETLNDKLEHQLHPTTHMTGENQFKLSSDCHMLHGRSHTQ